MSLSPRTFQSDDFHTLTIFPTANDVADAVAARLLEVVRSNPKSVLGLATGQTAKAHAVRRSLQAPPGADCPASFLKGHEGVHWYLDSAAAADLDQSR